VIRFNRIGSRPRRYFFTDLSTEQHYHPRAPGSRQQAAKYATKSRD
jgi:hypothetical protein